ncbi:MAG: 16S rRNA (guanine(527)-N(7))-methyltransferase RsmG [Fuerstiella sp.]
MTGSLTNPSTQQLQAALTRHHVTLADQFLPPLCRYCELLWDWNARINLTRHTSFDDFVTRDVIDSLRLSSHIPDGQTVLDVGSGGGVPGIILAVTRPTLTVSLAESVGKKARALTDITRRMKLALPVHAARAEDVLKQQRFDVLTVRAVAPLRKLLFWFQRRTSRFDQLLLIKGPRWVAEREEAAAEGLLDRASVQVVDQYATPGHDHESVILSVRFSADAAD